MVPSIGSNFRQKSVRRSLPATNGRQSWLMQLELYEVRHPREPTTYWVMGVADRSHHSKTGYGIEFQPVMLPQNVDFCAPQAHPDSCSARRKFHFRCQKLVVIGRRQSASQCKMFPDSMMDWYQARFALGVQQTDLFQFMPGVVNCE